MVKSPNLKSLPMTLYRPVCPHTEQTENIYQCSLCKKKGAGMIQGRRDQPTEEAIGLGSWQAGMVRSILSFTKRVVYI